MTLSTIERVLFLKGVELFGQIAGEDLVPVAAAAHEVSFHAGKRFIQQGDLGDCLYVLVAGEASIVIRGVGEVATRQPKSIARSSSGVGWRPPARRPGKRSSPGM